MNVTAALNVHVVRLLCGKRAGITCYFAYAAKNQEKIGHYQKLYILQLCASSTMQTQHSPKISPKTDSQNKIQNQTQFYGAKIVEQTLIIINIDIDIENTRTGQSSDVVIT